MEASLAYHEPGVVTILTQSSFLLLLNVGNFVLDHGLYCGLLGQVFLGVAFGTPGAKWLGTEAEHVIVQLGYLGLLLLVYEGGLSTSLRSLKANLWLSSCVALTGIALPMGLSFVLQSLTGATPLQAFAAGAALCSTSLGTTFTVLGSSGLVNSRLGVVLTSAAMMDDVVGLVMVQIISNLGGSDSSISAVTIVRPLTVSVAFALCAPIICFFIVKPITLWLNAKRANSPTGRLNQLLTKPNTAWIIHTLALIGSISGSTYAGTSNLFASYITGACISWWDAEVPHPVLEGTDSTPEPVQAEDSSNVEPQSAPGPVIQIERKASLSGLDAFEKYYKQPLERILRPFFFASIGFSIPITEMFTGPIVWKGLVYTVLMSLGKIACGVWLLRLPAMPKTFAKVSHLLKLSNFHVPHFWGQRKTKPPPPPPPNAGAAAQSIVSSGVNTSAGSQGHAQGTLAHSDPTEIKPRSLYPASILGCAMTARGEIGFLISSIAESNGVYSLSPTRGKSSDNFLVVTWAIMLCTILGPLAVGLLVRRIKQLQRGVEREGRIVRGDVLGVWGLP